MYLLSQMWLALILAALLGALIAWILGLCNCREADTSSSNFADGIGTGAGADSERRIAALEAELAEARVRADGLAREAADLRASPLAGEEGERVTMRNKFLEARVKFLEEGPAADPAAPPAMGLMAAAAGGAAVAAAAKPKKERAPAAKKAPAKAAEPVEETEAVTNETFVMSPAGDMTPDALEAAVLAAGAGVAPKRSRRRANPDNLLDILGVGPKNNAWLNEQGIYYFHQIATMNVDELAWLAGNLPTFGSRVYRENWVAQCARLARGLPPREG